MTRSRSPDWVGVSEMPSELALLSDVDPTTDRIVAIAASVHPDGAYIEFRGGDIRQFVDAAGAPLLCLFRTRPVLSVTPCQGRVMAPGIWPATGSIGSSSPA